MSVLPANSRASGRSAFSAASASSVRGAAKRAPSAAAYSNVRSRRSDASVRASAAASTGESCAGVRSPLASNIRTAASMIGR